MDWDKLRIFHAAAEAGSFTHAGDRLNMSQSAVSRQVSALEEQLSVALFHRHARGLLLTEQGELLYRTVHELHSKLQDTESLLADTKSKPFGQLRVTTTVGLGSNWLTPRLPEFVDLYPDIRLQLLLDDNELDLAMRKADVAIWMREPTQNDLIRRRLFTVHFHIFCSTDYQKKYGIPNSVEELDAHRILTFGGDVPNPIKPINWLETAGREDSNPRESFMRINNIYAIKQAVLRGVGLAVLPDYMADREPGLVPVLTDKEVLQFDSYFVYPEELRNSKRITVFRDFLLSKARQWSF